MQRRVPVAIAALCLMAVAACGGVGKQQTADGPPTTPIVSEESDCMSAPDTTLGAAGAYVHVTGALGSAPTITAVCDAPMPMQLVVHDISVGTGKKVAADGVVTAHYVGYGMTTRSVFDSSWPNARPLQFSLAGVIVGWSQGLPGMKEGGRRVLVIPGAYAYGEMPPTDAIKPNETLVFVVDLVSTP